MATHTESRVPGLVHELEFAPSGWFAAKQPGIIKFIEDRLGRERGEVRGVALAVATRLCGHIAGRDGVDPPRLASSKLELIEGKLSTLTATDLARDPNLIARAVDAVNWTEVPLTRAEWLAVARLGAVIDLALASATRGLEI